MLSTRYLRRILIKFEFSRQIFEKVSNIKFHQNLSSGSREVPCGRTDMSKLTVAFRNFSNAPKTENTHTEIGNRATLIATLTN